MLFKIQISDGVVREDWTRRYIKIDEKEEGFPIAVIGRDSYCAGLNVETMLGTDTDYVYNLQIGK